jgi:hypothetical protein
MLVAAAVSARRSSLTMPTVLVRMAHGDDMEFRGAPSRSLVAWIRRPPLLRRTRRGTFELAAEQMSGPPREAAAAKVLGSRVSPASTTPTATLRHALNVLRGPMELSAGCARTSCSPSIPGAVRGHQTIGHPGRDGGRCFRTSPLYYPEQVAADCAVVEGEVSAAKAGAM